ncbi:MAG: hypothetical protein ACFFD2_09745 [Promethearchaeota archaeon]
MVVTDYESLTEFIESMNNTCGYELVFLFVAMKLKDADGRFSRERLAEYFTEFYRIGETHNLVLEQECNPLKNENQNETIQMINRIPIGALLRAGILTTFERFNRDIFKILFDKEEEMLSIIKNQIIKYFLGTFGNSRDNMEAILSEWEQWLNESIKMDALHNVAGSIENISLESLLKYLYHSYSQDAYNKLLESFQINEHEITDIFTNGKESFSKSFKEGVGKLADIKKKSEVIKRSTSRLDDLTMFFQKMREEAEDEKKENTKKK